MQPSNSGDGEALSKELQRFKEQLEKLEDLIGRLQFLNKEIRRGHGQNIST